MIAQFYVALYPVGGPYLDPTIFFQSYLAGPFLIVLYLIWKIYSWFKVPAHRPFYIKIKDIDIYTGMRESQGRIGGPGGEEARRASISSWEERKKNRTIKDRALGLVRNII